MVEIIVALIGALTVVAVVQTIAKTIVSWRLAKMAIEAEDRRKREGLADWPIAGGPHRWVNDEEPHRKH